MDDILTPEQHDWLTAQVTRGDFPSVQDAARQLIDEGIALRATIENDDLAWAKPLVDAAIASVERGEVLSLAEHEARLDAQLALKGSWRG